MEKSISKTIRLEEIYHREKDYIALYFIKDFELINLIRSGAIICNTKICWYVEKRKGLVDEIIAAFQGFAFVDTSALTEEKKVTEPSIIAANLSHSGSTTELKEEHQKILRLMEQKLNLRGYSGNTLKTYLQQLKAF
jgi:hypothetical protein